MVWDDTTRAAGAAAGKDDGTDRDSVPNAVSDKSSELLRAKEMSSFSFGKSRMDVRGWPVQANDGTLIGLVESLFVDMRAKAVRYLGVALQDSATHASSGTVLVPVGTASRRVDEHGIVLNALSPAQLDAAPRVPNRPVTRTDENATLRVYGMATWRDVAAADLYSGPNFDEGRLFGERSTAN